MKLANLQEVHRAYENRAADLNAPITVRIKESSLEKSKTPISKLTLRQKPPTTVKTTVGRALLFEYFINNLLPISVINFVDIPKLAHLHQQEGLVAYPKQALMYLNP